MEPSDADVVNALDAIAEELGAERGLLGDWDIGSSGADDHDRAMTTRLWRFTDQQPDTGIGAIVELAQLAPNHPRLLRREPRDDQVEAGCRSAAADRGNLIGTLA